MEEATGWRVTAASAKLVAIKYPSWEFPMHEIHAAIVLKRVSPVDAVIILLPLLCSFIINVVVAFLLNVSLSRRRHVRDALNVILAAPSLHGAPGSPANDARSTSRMPPSNQRAPSHGGRANATRRQVSKLEPRVAPVGQRPSSQLHSADSCHAWPPCKSSSGWP